MVIHDGIEVELAHVIVCAMALKEMAASVNVTARSRIPAVFDAREPHMEFVWINFFMKVESPIILFSQVLRTTNVMHALTCGGAVQLTAWHTSVAISIVS
jgi:hypothetical protein